MSKALLALSDGTLFHGRSGGCRKTVSAEIVFNTSMTGYQEICTDPSYAGQIVLFTASHIGNTGVNREDSESGKVWVKGVIVREMSKTSSNWRSEKSFIQFLDEHQVPWIEGLDTRKLARHLRKNGTQNGCLMTGGDAKILLYDFGVKSSLLNALGCGVHVVPKNFPAAEALALNPDGIILSNGPGDPAAINLEEIRTLVFSGVPVLGICLGCQLIALAAGGSTRKLKFGHHGANHPVCDLKNNKVYITSQNHNFVVDETTLPPEFEVTHLSLIDGSVQGIRAKNYPVMGFQGHPEGAPGPQDMPLFQEFLEEVGHALRLLH